MTKTISFAAVHFTVAFSVGYLMTGSVLVGGAIALVEPAVNTVAYHFHEQVWNRLQVRGGGEKGFGGKTGTAGGTDSGRNPPHNGTQPDSGSAGYPPSASPIQ